MLFFAIFLCLSSLAVAQTYGNATSANDTVVVCKYLEAKYPQYFAWDTKGPAACAFFPRDAEQVSDAVKELNKYPSVRYTLKSGGHQPAPGFSSTNGGVMISFEPNFNSTVRTADGKHFIVGAGARWGSVYNVTGQTNQVAVGGRLGHIGVGGFVLGGGLSYCSAQYGLACDNVDNFEVVLADGTITNANATSHTDLYWALRGGGNQFAIVTRFTLQAHPAGDNGKVWGGVRSYNPDKREALFSAIANFVREYPSAKAAVIPTFQFGLPGNLLNVFSSGPMFFFFYDGATPPSGIFDEFDAIESSKDTTGTTDYYNLTNYAGGAAPDGFGASFREQTFPNMPTTNMTSFFEEVYQQVNDQSLSDGVGILKLQIMGFDPQPVSVRIAAASQAQGGNALGLDPADGDRIWIENNLLWEGNSCDQECPGYSQNVMDNLLTYHKQHYAGIAPTNYKSRDIETVSYNPLFMNDAAPDQDVYSSYGPASLARLKSIKKVYDPTGFFTNRQGGFKLPA